MGENNPNQQGELTESTANYVRRCTCSDYPLEWIKYTHIDVNLSPEDVFAQTYFVCKSEPKCINLYAGGKIVSNNSKNACKLE